MNNVQQVVAFATAARNGSFAKAARELSQTPSTIAKNSGRACWLASPSTLGCDQKTCSLPTNSRKPPNYTLHPSPGVGLGADFVRTFARRG